MMNSRRNNNNSRRTFIAIAVVSLVLVLGVTEYGTKGMLRNGTRDTLSVVWSAAWGLYDKTEASGFFTSKRALAEENQILRKERDELLTLQLQNDLLRSENASLRSFLKMHEANSEGRVTSVLSRPSTSPYDTFVIAGGKDVGFVVGDVVLVASGLAIGTIEEIAGHTSLVSLYSAPQSSYDVLVHEALLTYQGRGSGNGGISVPRDVGVVLGDLVSLPENGLVIGVVGHINAAPEDAYHDVRVAPVVNLSTLRFVEVIPRPISAPAL